MEESTKDVFWEDFSVCHRKSFHSDSFSIHFHTDIELFFLIAGGKTCLIDGNIFVVKPYDIIILKPDQIHKISRDESAVYERYILTAKPAFLQEFLSNEEFLAMQYLLTCSDAAIVSPDPDNCQLLLRQLAQFDAAADSIFPHSLRKIKFMEIFTLIFSLLGQKGNINADRLHVNQQIAPILDYMEDHFTTATLQSVAEEFHISKNYLCTLFKRNTAMTVHDYILSKKIAYAKKLLVSGSNATETAFLCGFNEFSNFIRVFKKYAGLSPKQYQLALKSR